MKDLESVLSKIICPMTKNTFQNPMISSYTIIYPREVKKYVKANQNYYSRNDCKTEFFLMFDYEKSFYLDTCEIFIFKYYEYYFSKTKMRHWLKPHLLVIKQSHLLAHMCQLVIKKTLLMNKE